MKKKYIQRYKDKDKLLEKERSAEEIEEQLEEIKCLPVDSAPHKLQSPPTNTIWTQRTQSKINNPSRPGRNKPFHIKPKCMLV